MTPLIRPIDWPRRFSGSIALYSCLLFFFFSSTPAQSRPTSDELAKAMASQLVCYPMELVNVSEPEITLKSEEMCLALIYRDLGPYPLWVTVDGPTAKAEVILEYIRNADLQGLDPQEYNLDRLLNLWHTENAAELAQLDTSLTYSLVKYIHDVSYGQLKPHETDPELFAEAGESDFNPLLTVKQVLVVSDLDQFFKNLPPQHYHYRSLVSALARYRKIAADGGWPQVAGGESLRPGEHDARVPTIRERLKVTGELQEKATVLDTNLYDPELEEAVKVFQRHHGLTQDGVIGKKTTAAMNITAAQKVDMIRINMARWRWHAHELGDKYIMVNIASFNLKAFQDNSDTPTLDFAVIVGQDQHQTPVFSDTVAYLDFNPYWNVTPSIAANEELPGLRKDPNHLSKRHIRVFSSWQPEAVELDSTTMDWHTVTPGRMRGYKLRQDPGPWNALGKVKFVFPNQYSVYMHDTASPNLFQRTKRDFSHGCIRVSNPLELAIFVLNDQDGGWTRDKVIDLYGKDTRKVVRLSRPVPVHITYQTVWVDKDGTINFNGDIYARDKKLLSILIK
ncbi:L,D-transpeptidase family protein [Desulfopila aestuarii]|uniref:Murein L,D-transpeptidase YcbB/YkuD n=1 Tax=Desulfopila aestuarii DSM 18488 TaxID=1121416 RepID=A0A1M7YCL1_9BACT|nr:L,D-transpeptidase family protein [Desulfopila aestuarii]SHO50248.1 Murein L,D-transpeptidase YcbB/YkuD [Desulfopila aestuarii DSM 18488]